MYTDLLIIYICELEPLSSEEYEGDESSNEDEESSDEDSEEV